MQSKQSQVTISQSNIVIRALCYGIKLFIDNWLKNMYARLMFCREKTHERDLNKNKLKIIIPIALQKTYFSSD